MAGTAGIFTGTGWSLVHLVLSVETGRSGHPADTGMELITMLVRLASARYGRAGVRQPNR
jgi:hypothetical protein